MTWTAEAIERLLPWSEPRPVVTRRGDRLLRTARPNPAFDDLYRQNRRAMNDAGVVISEYKGQRQVSWWQEVPQAVQQAKAERIEASRATDAEIDIPCPEGLAFRPYQKAGIAWALDCFKRFGGAIIGDEMGTGKSIHLVGIINAEPKIQRSLIVCPNTLKLNIYRELKKWLTRPLSVGIADASMFPTTDIVIIHYNVVHKYEKSLSYYWDLIALDEAHRCKTPGARVTKAIMGYRPTKKEREEGMQPSSGIPARRKLAMTGTPIQNRPMELFTLLQWIDPKRWKSRFEYGRRYCNGQQGWGGSWNFKGASRTDELQSELRSTFLIRRVKADVLKDLPPKQRQIIMLPADGLEGLIAEERKIEERWQAKLALVRAQKANPVDYEKAVELLKQTDADAKSSFRIAHEIGLAKVPLITEHTIEALDEGSKICFFAHHQDVISAYLKAFADYGPVRVIGGDSIVARQQAVDTFQRDQRCRIIVLSEAGKEGLTLTASSHVIMAELWWVPGTMWQMEDRCHRIGQANSVLIQYPLLEGSMDVKKLQTVIAKQEIIEGALDRRADGEQAGKPVPGRVFISSASNEGAKLNMAPPRADVDGRQLLLV